MRELKCLHCGGDLHFIKREKLQLGQTGWFLGDWPNILAGALDTEIYACPKCGKIEMFMPEEYCEPAEEEPFVLEELPPEADQHIVGVSRDGVPQVRCPNCGKRHDFDYPKCTYCGHDYYA